MSSIGLELENEIIKINTSAVKLRDEAFTLQNEILATLALITSILFILISIFISNIIVKSLNEFKDGLLIFFGYLNREVEDVSYLFDKRKDEFGEMAKVVNENITKTKKDIIQNANDSVKVVAEKILETIKKPFYIDNNQFQLSASVGIAVFNEHITYGELLRRAVVAMHNAKERGRDDFSFYDPLLQKKLKRKSILLEKLRDAINLNKIKIFYQKQVGVNEEVVGVEALSRWYDEELGNISPVEFIPIAEESGLIIKYGMYLIKEVAKVLKVWEKDVVKKDWRISINVSLSQFERNDFEFYVEDIITYYGINASLIRLEITESLLLKNANKAVKKIDFLKELGVSISIDDFGTGYSSLSYLKKLSIDELKIDKSFVDDIVTNECDQILVTAILSIGKKFGFDVIAEGVETKEMHEKLLSLGCEYFQGYFFAKPIEKENL